MKTLHLKTDMSCESCVATLKPILDAEPAIRTWSADVVSPDKVLSVSGEKVSESLVSSLIGKKGYHVLGEVQGAKVKASGAPSVSTHSLKTFYPLILIFSYILGFTFLRQWSTGVFDGHSAMMDFMGGFFIVFSFFKFLNLKGFVQAYSTYDLLAKKWPGYGYVYAFFELALGLAYLTRFEPTFTNAFTFVLMTFSSLGVIQALRQKRSIQCACLGTVFQLPMTYITVTEDLLMAGMALFFFL